MKKQINRYSYVRKGRRVSVRQHTRTYHTKNYGASSFSSDEDILKNKRRIRSISPLNRGRVPLKKLMVKKQEELVFPKKKPISIIKPDEEKDLKVFTAAELAETPPSSKEHAQKILALRKMSLYIPGGDRNILKLEKPKQFVSIDTGKMQLSNEEKLKSWTKKSREIRGQWARQVEQLERDSKQKAWEDYQKEHGALIAAQDVSKRLQRQLQLATSDLLRLPPQEQEKRTKEEEEKRRENVAEWTTDLRKKRRVKRAVEKSEKTTKEEQVAQKRKQGVSGMTGRDTSTLNRIKNKQRRQNPYGWKVSKREDKFVDDFIEGKYERK